MGGLSVSLNLTTQSVICGRGIAMRYAECLSACPLSIKPRLKNEKGVDGQGYGRWRSVPGDEDIFGRLRLPPIAGISPKVCAQRRMVFYDRSLTRRRRGCLRRIDPLKRPKSPLNVPPPRSTRFGSAVVSFGSRAVVGGRCDEGLRRAESAPTPVASGMTGVRSEAGSHVVRVSTALDAKWTSR
jgi:hypothetical protein